MTLDEAIKEMQGYNSKTYETNFITFTRALGLGIEALKLELLRRGKEPFVYLGHLPGETKE